MKKFFVAILAFLYISSSTGATVYMHYCMGKLAETGLSNHPSSTCEKCGMVKTGQKTNDCCKDQTKFFKSQTDQDVAVAAFHLVQPVVAAIPVAYIETPCVEIFTIPGENPVGLSPPLSTDVAVYIRNCVFLL